MKTPKIIIFTSLVWTAAIVTGCWLFGFAKPKTVITSQAYHASEYDKWVSLPDDAHEVFVHFYGGHDTNYRVVSFQSAVASVNEIIDSSLKKNVQHQNEQVSRLEDIRFSLDGLFSAFMYGDDAIPSWWIKTPLSDDYKATIVYWAHNNYGMGYLIIHDVGLNQVRILQFSQQWLTLDIIRKAFPGSK